MVKAKKGVLKEIMDRRGQTPTQFSAVVGIHPSYLSMIMNGTRSPSAKVINSLIDVTEKKFDDLFEIVE